MITYCVTLCEEGLHVRKDEWDGWELVTEVQNFAIVPYQGPPITAGTDSHHIAGIVATELRLPDPDSVDHDGDYIYLNYKALEK